MTSTWKPTKKWVATLITGLAGIAASWVVTGAFDDVERGMTGTLITSLAVAYFTPNTATRRNGERGQGLIELLFALLLLLIVVYVLVHLF